MKYAKEKLKKILRYNRILYLAIRRLWCLLKKIRNIRVVILEDAMLNRSLLIKMSEEAVYNSIIDDLIVFTGLSKKQVHDRLLRKPATHFKSEFRWHSPKDNNELTWFYRCSYGYLFANATHPYWEKLDFLNPQMGRVLDYGSGVGNNVIALAKRGFKVDYFEINHIQEAFTRFRVFRHKLNNIFFISPFINSKFDTIRCITHIYGAVILKDVLEHIPNYHILLSYLIEHIKTGGYIIESTPFNQKASAIDIHLKPFMLLKDAMKGMQQIEKGIWQKTRSEN